MQRTAMACLVAAAIVNIGCATIAHGTGQDVTVTSEPSAAHVTLLTREEDGRMVKRLTGTTPVVISVPRRAKNLVIRLERDGCPPVDMPLKRTVSGWVAGNLIVANPMSMQGMDNPGTQYPQQLLIGLPVMFGIDALTGGAYNLPKHVHAPPCGP